MPSVNPEEAFSAGIKRPGTGPFYTIGLLGVTIVMVLLPIIYLSLIGVVIYATYYHAAHNYSWMNSGMARGRGVVLILFAYITPIFMGAVLTFFMVKPFFAKRIDQHQPYALNPEAEPVLYDFIARVCAIVGAPMPSLIELDCDINASASLRHGFGSFFKRDLALTIGLPLVAGLTVREFAGVLAHEFGHFTQGTAMRLTYIIHRIDGWFARVIWERDAWDERLEEMSEDEENSGLALMASFAKLGVWLSRKILTLLLFVGHGFTCYLSRRMEFHADQFEIRVAGSASFERVVERLNTLNTMFQAGLYQMRVTWNLNNRLPDNLPQFILNVEGTQMGIKARKALIGQIGFVKTGLFHTHPSDAARVREARAANEPGVVSIDAPATELFENFPVPARIVTTLFYEGTGFPLPMAKIYPVDTPQPKSSGAAVAADESADTADAAVDRYFSGIVTPLRPIFPSHLQIVQAQIAETINAIQALPGHMSAISDQIAEACTNFDRADKMMLAAAQSDTGTAEAMDVATWRLHREQARRSLHSVFDSYTHRLSSALALATAPESRQKIAVGIQTLQKLQPILKLADTLRVSTAALARQGADELARDARVREEVADIEAAMRDVPCPGELGQGVSLFQYFQALPVAQEPFLVPRAEGLAAVTMAAYTRALGDLVAIAEQTVDQLSAPNVMRVQSA